MKIMFLLIAINLIFTNFGFASYSCLWRESEKMFVECFPDHSKQSRPPSEIKGEVKVPVTDKQYEVGNLYLNYVNGKVVVEDLSYGEKKQNEKNLERAKLRNKMRLQGFSDSEIDILINY